MTEEKTFKCAFCGTEQTEAGKILKEGSRPPAPAQEKKKKKENPEKKEKKVKIPEKKQEPRKSIFD